MESLFIINSSGDVFLEKHWRSVISKSICDYFLEKMKSCNVSEIEKLVKILFTVRVYNFRTFHQ